jgi:hypothetical protein
MKDGNTAKQHNGSTEINPLRLTTHAFTQVKISRIEFRSFDIAPG